MQQVGSSAARLKRPKKQRLWQSLPEIEQLRPAWEALEAAARPPHPFLSWSWQCEWLRAHPRLRPLVLVEWQADGELAALLPLCLRPHPILPRLEWLAEGSGGDEMDLLLSPGAEAEAGPRLLQHLYELKTWWIADLHSLVMPSRLAACLVAVGRPPATPVRIEYELPWLELPASFEKLLAGCSSNFRSEIRRRRRAWERHFGGLQLECITSPPRVAEMLPELFRLHNQRQKQKGQDGIFEAAMVREFHRRLALDPTSGRQFRLYLLYGGARAQAALYGYQTGDRFAFFQSGFDAGCAAWSPGTVLMSCVLEDCIQRGDRWFDFLRGDEPYKHRWTRQARHTERIRLARTPLARLALWRPHFSSGGALRSLFPPETGRIPSGTKASGWDTTNAPNGGDQHSAIIPAPPARHALSYRLRAAWWFIRTTRNWPSVLAHKLLGWRLRECRFRDGSSIEFLSPRAELWQLGEIFRERVYDREFPDLPSNGWIVDLGANIGCFSLRAAQHLAPSGQVLAVEPNPACVSVLRRNLERNRVANVRVQAAAVSGRAGTRHLLLSTRSTDCRLTASRAEPPMESLPVETCTLEQVLAGIPRVALLKMDIEGEEFEVLWQTPRRVWQGVDRLALEYHCATPSARAPRHLLAHLEWLGFEIRRHYAPEPHVGYVLAQRRFHKETA